jgi:hypothetical protein
VQHQSHVLKIIMKYLLFITAFIVAATTVAVAQNCNTQMLLQKPGAWKPGMKGSQGGTAAELAKEKKTVAFIHSMIQGKYSPVAVQAIFYGTYNPFYANMTGNEFAYNIIPLEYYCNGNTIATVHETSTFFEIAANQFESEIYDTAQGDRLLAEGFNVMKDLPVLKDGYWLFKQTEKNNGMGNLENRAMWLITYDGKLPYSYVTKKEFLERRKKALSIEMGQTAAGFKNNLDNIETERSFKEKEFKNDPEKMTRYMKMDYLQLKERYQKLLAKNESDFAPAFAKLEAQLQLPASELSATAIVKKDTHDYLSYLFTNDDDPFGQILIKPNPAYFNKKLPRSSPQFFWVYVRADFNVPVAKKFMTDIVKAIDFDMLKNMLGK